MPGSLPAACIRASRLFSGSNMTALHGVRLQIMFRRGRFLATEPSPRFCNLDLSARMSGGLAAKGAIDGVARNAEPARGLADIVARLGIDAQDMGALYLV